jgi:hypothetical protein
MELDTGNHLLLDSVTGATDSNLSAITIDGAAGNDTVTLNAADAPPIAFLPGSGADVLNLDSGTYTLTAADADAPNLTINDYSLLQVAAAGATTFAPTIGALNLDSSASYGTGNAVLLPSDSGAQTVLTVGSISMQSPTAQSLNLNDNNLIVQNSSFATISADVMQSYAGGTWLGAGGIGSAAAATDATHLHTLGMVWNDDGAGHAIYSSFDGQPVGVDAILIRYTLWGDANLDGVVNTADYLLIDNGFALHLTGWRNGDFNYGAVVDGDDYSLIDNAFNEQNAASFAAAASPAATSSPAAVTANAANEVAASGSGAADQSAPVGSTSFNAAIAVRPNDPPAAPVNWGETNTADLSLAGLLDQWTIGDNE